MSGINGFNRQIKAMYSRLEQLYSSFEQSSDTDLVPSTWKELGVAVEELQVANEELTQQNTQIAEALQNNAEQHYYYQSLLNHIPEAYIVTTVDGKIQEANLMATRLLRVEQLHLVGKLLISFVLADYRTPFRTELIRLSRGNQTRTWSAWFQPRDTAPVHLALTTSAVSNPPDGQVRLHWILREMTETWAAITPARERDSLLLANAADKIAASLKETVAPTLDDRPSQRYEKGETIPLYPQLLWQVQQGLVKLHTLTEDNEEVLLGLIGPSTPFGLGSTFLPVYQATAMTAVKLIQFSLAEVKAIPDLAQTLLPKLNQRFHQIEALLAIAAQRRVKHRLCLLLRLLQQEIGEPVACGTRLSLRLTHEDLASACCTTRVTITRLMGELQKHGDITIDSKYHILLKENF